MLKNYLTVAWRNLRRHRAFSFINIGGLAVGMASALLIFLYVQDELSYDRHHTNKDRIYRLVLHVERGSQEALVNETAVRQMGWESPEAALGKEAGWGTVVGVVKDFHFASFHQKIEPLMMLQPLSDRARTLMLRIDGRDVFGTLAALEKTWRPFSTDLPFEFSFLKDELNQLYQREQRAAQVFGIFAGLAILIACLGLFGLAAFTAEQRTKELGIRKALCGRWAGNRRRRRSARKQDGAPW